MNSDDFKKIKTIVKEEVSASEKRLRKDLSKTEQKLKKEISASEQRLRGEISASEQRLRGEISASANSVMTDIGQYMEDNLFPMIDEKADKTDIDRLEGKLDRLINASKDYEIRIKDIERIPVIANELKFKKLKVAHD